MGTAPVRILVWHGWLLEGTGSNVYAARTVESYRKAGHDVLLLCQEGHPERYGWLDAWGEVGEDGVSPVRPTGVPAGPGRAVLLRPEIGSLLPVFVLDEYEGFRVKRFLELEDRELETYLARNVSALRAAAAWHRPDAVIVGHAIPGAVVAARALGPGRFVAKVHGSDLEYAARLQPRYLELAREGLSAARAVSGAGDDVLARTAELVPAVAGRLRKVPPGVEVERFRPMARADALLEAAALLDADPDTARGRPDDLDRRVRDALAARDARALEILATSYDQAVPDPGAAARLRSLAGHRGSLVGYFGKLIPQKGVERLIEALALAGPEARGLVVGFGLHREWLAALVAALGAGDRAAYGWLRGHLGLELSDDEVAGAAGLGGRLAFTGRLDHRYAPRALAALDVAVAPSVLAEAFGMVAAEAAAAGALPVVARHSGLAEVAAALEGALGRPGLLSFEPGPGSARRLGEAVRRILALDPGERERLRAEASRFAAETWTWGRTAERLLAAALD